MLMTCMYYWELIKSTLVNSFSDKTNSPHSLCMHNVNSAHIMMKLHYKTLCKTQIKVYSINSTQQTLVCTVSVNA